MYIAYVCSYAISFGLWHKYCVCWGSWNPYRISIVLNLFPVPSLKPHLGDRSEALFLLFLLLLLIILYCILFAWFYCIFLLWYGIKFVYVLYLLIILWISIWPLQHLFLCIVVSFGYVLVTVSVLLI